jgi:hypothetical protein
MKAFQKTLPLVLVVTLLMGAIQAWGGEEGCAYQGNINPESDLYNFFDLLIARPAAAIMGIAGAGIVVLSLPFTIPTKSVDRTAYIFVKRPFRYAFNRDFPDENVY